MNLPIPWFSCTTKSPSLRSVKELKVLFLSLVFFLFFFFGWLKISLSESQTLFSRGKSIPWLKLPQRKFTGLRSALSQNSRRFSSLSSEVESRFISYPFLRYDLSSASRTFILPLKLSGCLDWRLYTLSKVSAPFILLGKGVNIVTSSSLRAFMKSSVPDMAALSPGTASPLSRTTSKSPSVSLSERSSVSYILSGSSIRI